MTCHPPPRTTNELWLADKAPACMAGAFSFEVSLRQTSVAQSFHLAKGTYALRSGKQRSQPASYRAWRARGVRACHTDCPRSSHGTQHRRPCPNSRPFRHSLPCQSSKASFPWSPRMMQRGACRHACFCAGQHGRRKPSCHSTDRQAFHLARPTSGPVGPSGSELWIEPRTSQSGQG